MIFETDPNEWIVSALFRPTGPRGAWYPHEVTATGMTRRLRQRAQDGFLPRWEHPKVQSELVRQMARRCSRDLLPVVQALLRHFKNEAQDAARGALLKAMAADHPEASRNWAGDRAMAPASLLERILTLYWPTTDPVVTSGKLEHRSHSAPELPPVLWRQLTMDIVRVRQGALPGSKDQWCGLIQAMRLENTDEAWSDLHELLTLRPDLVMAAPKSSAHLPLLGRATTSAAIDQRSLDLFIQHGGDLTQNVPTCMQASPNPAPSISRIHRAWNDELAPSAPGLVPENLPLWMVLALHGHGAAEAWGHHHQPELVTRLTHVKDSLHLMRMDSRSQQMSPMVEYLKGTRAWANPQRDRVRRATADQPGDTHPLWAAVRHESRLLKNSLVDDTPYAPGLVQALRQRSDLRQASDSEGGNLWWAMVGALDHFQSPAFEVLAHKSVALACLPDRFGHGVLFRHPDLAGLLDKAKPMSTTPAGAWDDSSEETTPNLLLAALQNNPEGFFGNTPDGRERTAEAMWDALTKNPWFRQSQALKLAEQTLMAFHLINPETLCPKLRLFVAVLLTLHRDDRLTIEDLSPWMVDPESAGIDPEHVALVHLSTTSSVFSAAFRAVRTRSLDPPVLVRRRARP